MGKKKEKLIMEKQFDDLIKEMKKLKKKVSKKMEGDYLEYKESDPTIDFRKEELNKKLLELKNEMEELNNNE